MLLVVSSLCMKRYMLYIDFDGNYMAMFLLFVGHWLWGKTRIIWPYCSVVNSSLLRYVGILYLLYFGGAWFTLFCHTTLSKSRILVYQICLAGNLNLLLNASFVCILVFIGIRNLSFGMRGKQTDSIINSKRELT